MNKLRLVALLAVLSGTGCYHAVIDTGRTPSGQTVKKEWAHGFAFGLVPPDVMSTAQQCPDGVARVETQHSFMNQLAYLITAGIYSPMTIEVQCAAPAGGEQDALLRRDGAATAHDVLARAIQRSARTGDAVYVDLR